MLTTKFSSIMLFLIAVANVISVMHIRQELYSEVVISKQIKDIEFEVAKGLLQTNNCIASYKNDKGYVTFFVSMPRLLRGDVPTHTTALCANIIANYPVQTVVWINNLNSQNIEWKEE